MSVSIDVTFSSGSPALLILCGSPDADGNMPPVNVQEVYINGSRRTAASWFEIRDVEQYGNDIRGTLTCLRPADKFEELCTLGHSGHVLINAAGTFTVNVFFHS
jgi:hypothetical protein